MDSLDPACGTGIVWRGQALAVSLWLGGHFAGEPGDDTSASKKQGRDSGLSFVLLSPSLDPNDQKSLEGMQKMEKEESPTDATQEEDVDDMEGSGEEGDLEGSDSEAAQWADQEQWFGMQ